MYVGQTLPMISIFLGEEEKVVDSFHDLQQTDSGEKGKVSKTTVSSMSGKYYEEKIYEEKNEEHRKADKIVIVGTEYGDIDDSKDIPNISVPDYHDHLGLAVGVLVTVIVMLIVTILGILYKNYQYGRQKHWVDRSHYSEQPQTTGYTQQGGLIYNQTSEEVYPLYPSYHNSTISTMSVPYDHTSHYATADLLHFSHNNYGRSQPVGV